MLTEASLTEIDLPPVIPGASALNGETWPASPYEFRSIAGRDFGKRRDPGPGHGIGEAALQAATDAAMRQAFEEGRREGEWAVRKEVEAATTAAIAQERAKITAALNDFRDTRDRYFAAVEQEVVRLSLAIAARVLHREVQLDPLLLSGIVHVALDKLADRTGVMLRVSTDQLAAWQKIFESIDTADRPKIMGDASLGAGDCQLETRMGTVELGVAAQLEEIERGFFDLINRKPVS
ncbi:MAG TPA: FliH/SctL family protein [Acidobacteriaceae bacterium]